MPQPVPLPVRQRLFALSQRGWSPQRIAEHLALSVRTVRHLLQRFRQQPDALPPSYAAGPGRPPASHPVRDMVLALRQQHPQWGAGYIRVQLSQALDTVALPSERTLQRLLRQAHCPAALPGRLPPCCRDKAAFPHDVVQIDAAEQMRLRDGQGASWLRLVDECSGAFLHTHVFPPVFLDAGRRTSGSAADGSPLRPLGAAEACASGQRQAVGIDWRLAAGVGDVAVRLYALARIVKKEC